MIKLYKLDDPATDTWLFAYDREYVAKHEHSETTVSEGFFVTADKLEQLQREAWESGRDIITCGTYPGCGYTQCETFKDYLSSKSKEGK